MANDFSTFGNRSSARALPHWQRMKSEGKLAKAKNAKMITSFVKTASAICLECNRVATGRGHTLATVDVAPVCNSSKKK